MIRFVPITCPSCHAAESEPLSPGHYRCTHCRSVFLLDNGQGAAGSSAAGAAQVVARRGLRGHGGWIAGVFVAALVLGAVLARRQPPVATTGRTGGTGRSIDSAPIYSATKVGPAGLSRRAGAPVQSVPERVPRVELRDLHHSHNAIGGEFWLVRYVNTGDVPVERPAAVVSLFDAAGHRVEEQSGWSALHVLPPGQQVPILVLVARPPVYARAEIKPRAPKAPSYTRPQARLTVTEQQVQTDGFLGPAMVGTVRNTSGQPVRFIELVVMGTDAGGGLVSLSRSHATNSDLEPGESSGFKVGLSSFRAAPPTRYEVTALASFR